MSFFGRIWIYICGDADLQKRIGIAALSVI